ncbi:MAG TPA: GreA/GreB family elongation factor [Opitutaceae bacterium]|nr:GreA/GreB family elongation factor [Opitutaceae bacterium]
MSRAFLKESTLEEPEVRPPGLSALPAGARNLMTPEGLARLRERLAGLAALRAERSREAGEEARRELMLLDERIRPLERSVRTAEAVAPPPPAERDRVRFGAAVAVRDPQGSESRYRIVGVDEADPERGDISYLSPLARALINRRAGEKATVASPRGPLALEVVSVSYGPT